MQKIIIGIVLFVLIVVVIAIAYDFLRSKGGKKDNEPMSKKQPPKSPSGFCDVLEACGNSIREFEKEHPKDVRMCLHLNSIFVSFQNLQKILNKNSYMADQIHDIIDYVVPLVIKQMTAYRFYIEVAENSKNAKSIVKAVTDNTEKLAMLVNKKIDSLFGSDVIDVYAESHILNHELSKYEHGL